MNSTQGNESVDDNETRDEDKPISSRWDLQESWAELEEATPTEVVKGEIIPGMVVAIQDQYVVVDVGAKFEGVVPRNEFADEEELPAEAEEIEVAVVYVDDDKGLITLSKKRADYERAWQKLYEAQQNGDVLTAMVTDRVKGGLHVNVGMTGFVPASHVAVRDVRQLDKLVGKTLRLKVLEVDRSRNQIVLSHRQVIEEERTRRREETLARLDEGVVCEGKVRNLTNYGAFIDLGGVDGLLHISEMSWSHIDHPSDVVKSGEIIRVMVLDIEEGGERISLGRRQLLPDPWKQAAKQLKVDSIVDATVTRLVSTGAFARLKEVEIEGFIPLREMSSRHIKNADEVLSEGQQIQVKLLDITPEAHRMTLSLVGAEAEQIHQEYEEYMKGQQGDTVKLGDQFGDMLQQAKAGMSGAQASEEAEAEVVEETCEEEAEPPEAVAESEVPVEQEAGEHEAFPEEANQMESSDEEEPPDAPQAKREDEQES